MSQKSPAIIRGETVDELARHTVRWTSLIVLSGSFIGSVMAFNGAWPDSWRVWEQVSIVAAIAGIALQAFCTLLEWANRRHRASPAYLGPLMLDIGSTYIGYAPLLIPPFQRGLLRAGLPTLPALIAAHAGLIVLAWWLAYYPEQNLVKE